ncbi:unnamed protein product [Arabidopsis lyrata]|nr:unnamed protein product [Arabidopsis lyrata]
MNKTNAVSASIVSASRDEDQAQINHMFRSNGLMKWLNRLMEILRITIGSCVGNSFSLWLCFLTDGKEVDTPPR